MSFIVMIIKDGVCAFHRSYGEMTFDDVHLIGGFFHALLVFSRELGEGLIDSLKFPELDIYFKSLRGLAFVLGVRKEISLAANKIESILNNLSNAFHEEYPKASEWDGNVAAFDDFTKVCDEILQQRPSRKGFPLLLKVTLKPFLVGPALQILFINAENQKHFYELNHRLQSYSESLGSKKLKELFRKPSLVYLPNSQYLAYTYPFYFMKKKGDIFHLLCFLIEETDWFMLYQLSNVIYKKTQQILPKIIHFIQMYNKNPSEITEAAPIIQDLVEDWADLNQYMGGVQASLFEEYYKSGITSDSLDEEQASIQFNNLITQLGDDMDKVIFALLTQEQIVFVGDSKELVEQTLSALLNFYPHPSVVLWTEEPSNYLIVGTNPNNVKNFKENTVIVDLRNNRITGGESNEFCSNLMEKTIQLAEMASINEARVYFQGKISNIFSLLKILFNITGLEEEKQPDELKKLLTIHSPAVLNLIAKMCNNLNLILAKNIQKFLSVQKMTEFMLPGFK